MAIYNFKLIFLQIPYPQFEPLEALLGKKDEQEEVSTYTRPHPLTTPTIIDPVTLAHHTHEPTREYAPSAFTHVRVVTATPEGRPLSGT